MIIYRQFPNNLPEKETPVKKIFLNSVKIIASLILGIFATVLVALATLVVVHDPISGIYQDFVRQISLGSAGGTLFCGTFLFAFVLPCLFLAVFLICTYYALYRWVVHDEPWWEHFTI